MTDQSNTPVPPGQLSGDEQDKSLIERAVKAFDWRDLAPPPVPVNLAPPVVKPAQRHRAEPVPPVPVAAAPAPVTEAANPPPQAPQSEPVSFPEVRHPVDRRHLREQGLIVPEGSVTALLEEFRIVKRQLLLNAADMRRAGRGAASQRILICSPHPGEGKTYCALNLALSLAAEREVEVVLVDADFAKPSILSALGMPGGPGLMDALIDPQCDVAKFVLGTDIPGLWVLPAGNATTSDSEYLASSRTRDVLDRLIEGAPNRLVIFDSPPVLAASPAAELAKYVGQAVLIVRADQTGQGALEDAVSLLSGCPNIELLLNAATFSPSGRRFGTYYGYRG
jgi:Mrp family chromosome partitioning ATPase